MSKQPSETSFDLEVTAWADAFQATQKRTRTGVLLCALASCIVLLMVFNLCEARRLRKLPSISGAATSSEYMNEISRHVADEGFYQIPSLGIQITCDNVGLFGPLALLVFSLYSVMAFKAFDCQVNCGAKFPSSDLRRSLLEASQFDKVFSAAHALRLLLFLPFITCLSVIGYVIYAHVLPPSPGDPLNDIRSQTLTTARTLDFFGLLCALMVLAYNFRTLRFFSDSQWKIRKCLDAPEQSRSAAA